MSISEQLGAIRSRLPEAMLEDRQKISKRLQTLTGRLKKGKAAAKLENQLSAIQRNLEASIRRKEGRLARRPKLSYPRGLPIFSQKDAIVRAIKEHQVVIVSGDTGSGKSTTLAAMIDYKLLNQLLYDGRADEVRALVQRALSDGRPVDEVLAKGLIEGMRVVGEDFKHNRIFVPQVLVVQNRRDGVQDAGVVDGGVVGVDPAGVGLRAQEAQLPLTTLPQELVRLASQPYHGRMQDGVC